MKNIFVAFLFLISIASNAQKIIRELKPKGIHFSATTNTLLDEDSAFSEKVLKVDPKKVNRIVSIIRE